jgi:carbamoyl-phosphate synthase large subunit
VTTKVMIAGIGGASLGTEIMKCLRHAGGYQVYGCDVSPAAYGLYDSGFDETYRIARSEYLNQVIQVCHRAGTRWLIPGGEQPMLLLMEGAEQLAAEGVRLVSNARSVVETLSDKDRAFALLRGLGIRIPRTRAVHGREDIEAVGLPCIVKPATGSGGSVSVFFATSADEASVYAELIRRTGSAAIAQEYVADDEGEFTIGVLSLPDGSLVGSIALRRTLDPKLSVAFRGRGGVVSSGYSQGYIDVFPELCTQAETIAQAVGSTSALNVQARVRDGVLIPFEINPRFSASSFLRTLAGFNEIDMTLRYHASGKRPERPSIRPGWYLRSLTEHYIPVDRMK